jgi:hypothetical protein
MEWLAEKKSTLQLASFLMVMLAFPALNAGLRGDDWIAWVGLLMVAVGFAVPPVIKLLSKSGDDAEDDDSDAEKGQGDDDG